MSQSSVEIKIAAIATTSTEFDNFCQDLSILLLAPIRDMSNQNDYIHIKATYPSHLDIDSLEDEIKQITKRSFPKVTLNPKVICLAEVYFRKDDFLSKTARFPLRLNRLTESRLKRRAKLGAKVLASMCISALSACGSISHEIDQGSKRLGMSEKKTPKSSYPHKNFDPELTQILIEFEEDAAKSGIDIVPEYELRVLKQVSGTSLPNNALGSCVLSWNSLGQKWGEVSITVKEEWVDDSQEPYDQDAIFKRLVYHELAHCLLNFEHSDDENHIMFSELSGSSPGANEVIDEQVEDLFSKNSFDALVE